MATSTNMLDMMASALQQQRQPGDIDWCFYKQPPAATGDGFAMTLTNLTADDARDVLTLLLSLQQRRKGDVMSPTEYNSAFREIDEVGKRDRFAGLDLEASDEIDLPGGRQ